MIAEEKNLDQKREVANTSQKTKYKIIKISSLDFFVAQEEMATPPPLTWTNP
jgi:hypothetical protein